MTCTIGIDPGKSGGIVCLSGASIEAHKMPETVGDLVDCLRSAAAAGYLSAYVERVHAMPKQGVTSCFTFGRGLGNIEAACQCLGIRLEWVNPGAWQKALGCLSGGDKNVTKRRAQELFPTIKVTHAIADALLIAEYGSRLEASRRNASVTPV